MPALMYEEVDTSIDYTRSNLRWNGWGAADREFVYAPYIPAILDALKNRMGVASLPKTPSVSPDELTIPKSRFSAGQIAALAKLVGKDSIHTSREERTIHAVGRSYYDVLRLRLNAVKSFPDAVVYPGSEKAVIALLAWAAKNRTAVVPYGGGSSVVGGLEMLHRKGQRAVLCIDLTRLNRLLALDRVSRLATFEAGIYGPVIEGVLNPSGYTLGHFPQSFEYSTLGGWVAARSAGQQSNKYGKIEELLNSMRLVTPKGVIETHAFPASAAGPDMDQVASGSEGLLGIITQATVKIHEIPEYRHYFAVIFPDFAHGAEFVRRAAQDEIPLAMSRLSDPGETNLLEMLSEITRHGTLGKVKGLVQGIALKLMRVPSSHCVLVCGLDGHRADVLDNAFRARELARACGGRYVGTASGRGWLRTRFNMPFLRNHLMENGVGVDTMETSAAYANIDKLHEAVLNAVKKNIPGSLGMCHISHSYLDGACLYFTFMFPMDLSHPIQQWFKLKKIVSDQIVQNGGTISHHHGVGADHAPWYVKEAGPTAVSALRALKASLDPAGIMNPGKLFDQP